MSDKKVVGIYNIYNTHTYIFGYVFNNHLFRENSQFVRNILRVIENVTGVPAYTRTADWCHVQELRTFNSAPGSISYPCFLSTAVHQVCPVVLDCQVVLNVQQMASSEYNLIGRERQGPGVLLTTHHGNKERWVT